uniref:Uncharacterized protein n=1 Tax=Candidatus Kentrum sp. FM TaxID=2126340 RepID=A0A450SIW8_9GAMM|nr:MAG: hypothetical protein BECKFM1743A_GA0114220_1010910 [Candidatus Kentron sp. FM]VFJ53325.1 MAG: hypothetical protein BECKFM1743C_GA0114222_1012210 [Candidatus Kentron sp. FM]VFK09799.1 MAG: hypothetical protein BECKFM1743B_GA0114221_1011510 [Candidatus Kentron sp. FM]
MTISIAANEKTESRFALTESEVNELELHPAIREEIDRDIAIAREQFRNGQYKKLDDKFMEGFLEEAHKRNGWLFKKSV